MDHDAEPHRYTDSRSVEAGEHATSDVPAHHATPGDMLRQLARGLRTSQTSQLAAKDPFGTTLPGLDDSWNDAALQKRNAQYFKDLRASMTFDQFGEVVTDDVQAIRDRWDKIAAAILVIETNRWVARKGKGRAALYAGGLDLLVQALGWVALGAAPLVKLQAWLAQVERVEGNEAELEVAKYKFAEFMLALGILPLGALAARSRTSAGRKGHGGGLPTTQAPAPWKPWVPDWRRFVPSPPTVVAGGPGGGAAIEGWLGNPPAAQSPHALPGPDHGHYLQEDAAHEYVMPAPLGSTQTATPGTPAAQVWLPPITHRETVKQIFFDYKANTRPDRARLFERLTLFLTKEVGISDALWGRLRKLHPLKIEQMLETTGFLEGASSTNPELRRYVEALADRCASTDLTQHAFKHYVRTAQALLNMPEATELQPLQTEGTEALHFHAIVNGEKVFLKMAKDPDFYSSINKDLQAGSDTMKMSPRGAVRCYMLVRVRDINMEWREAVAIELLKGQSLYALHRKITKQQDLPFPVTSQHVRSVRAIQETARIGDFDIDDEHDANVIAEDDLERPIVAVDMRIMDGPYSVPQAEIDPMFTVRELAEYSRLKAKRDRASDKPGWPTAQELSASQEKLKRLFASYQPKKPRARATLLTQVRELLTNLGVDESIYTLLVPKLDTPHLRALIESKGFLEGIASPNESHRLHTEDLAWEYSAHRLSRDEYVHEIGEAQSVAELPPVLGLTWDESKDAYRGMLHGESVHVKAPSRDQTDSQIDSYLEALRDKHPTVVRALDPEMRIWRRAVAWRD